MTQAFNILHFDHIQFLQFQLKNFQVTCVCIFGEFRRRDHKFDTENVVLEHEYSAQWVCTAPAYTGCVWVCVGVGEWN